MRATVRRWYSEPALVEAVFEMRPDQPGDALVHGLDNEAVQAMLGRLRGFTARTEKLEVHAPVSRYDVAPGQHATDGDAFRVCTWNEDGDRGVQFGGGVCAFNVLSPYGHYEDHLPSLRRIIQTYLEVGNIEVGFHCAHRYLNVFPLQPFEKPNDLFCFYPPLPANLVDDHVAVSVRIEAVKFRNGACTVRLWRHELHDEVVVYRMESASRSDIPVEADVDAILEWHQIAHDAVNRAFDMSITPVCRKRLREL